MSLDVKNTLCPSHHLPLDRKRAWTATGDAFMCPECESLLLARRASRPIPHIPENASPGEALEIIFSGEV